jgi:HK97 family phage major capsid protein
MTPKIDITTIRPATKQPKFDLIGAILKGAQFIGESSYERTISEQNAEDAGIPAAGIFLRVPGMLGLSEGAGTVQTTVLSIADALRPYSALAAAGARFLTDIKSNISIPRLETTATVSLLNDGDAVTASNETFSALTLNALRYRAQVGFNSMLLKSAKQDVKSFVAGEIMRTVGSVLDQAAITAILALTSQAASARALDKCYGVTMSGAVTHAKTVSMKQAVLGASVQDNGTFAWILDSATYGKLTQASKGGSYPEFILEDDMILNSKVFVTENLAATHKMAFLRASDVIIAIHGVDLVSDVMSLAYKGQVLLTCNVLASAGVLRGPAVCRSEDSAAAYQFLSEDSLWRRRIYQK